MVNKTLLPPRPGPRQTSKSFQNRSFRNWHGFRSDQWRTGAWESLGGSNDPRKTRLGGLASRLIEGENQRWRIRFSSDFRGRWCWSGRWTSSPTTSRTSTPTADRSMFQEYLASEAHEDNFLAADRRVSYVQDRAIFHDFSQRAVEQTN